MRATLLCPHWAEPLSPLPFLFFSTAGVLKGARCGSESKGGEGIGGGVAEMLGWVEEEGQNAPTCPRGHPATGQLPDLWSFFHVPAGPWERSEGRDDKLSQVSSGRQGRERVTGTVVTATSPWEPDT